MSGGSPQGHHLHGVVVGLVDARAPVLVDVHEAVNDGAHYTAEDSDADHGAYHDACDHCATHLEGAY